MASLSTYKNLGPGPVKVVDGATGEGGAALSEDLKSITDAVLNAQTTLSPTGVDPTVQLDQSSFGTFDIDLTAGSSGSDLTLQWNGQSPVPTDEGVYDGQEITIRILQRSSGPVTTVNWPSNVDFGPFSYTPNASGQRDLLKLIWAKNAGAGTWEVILVAQGYS